MHNRNKIYQEFTAQTNARLTACNKKTADLKREHDLSLSRESDFSQNPDYREQLGYHRALMECNQILRDIIHKKETD